MAAREKAYRYERLLRNVRKQWDEHPDDCESLKHFWFGASGGVSCPSDLSSCDECYALFFWEGLTWANQGTPDDDEIWLCACCARSRNEESTDAS